MNLFKETIEKLEEHGKSWGDVIWCGSPTHRMSPDRFKDIAVKTDYDSGFGGKVIAEDLLVVGVDFWLERHDYDGSEWWEFKKLPLCPGKLFTGKSLTGSNYWMGLNAINDEGGK